MPAAQDATVLPVCDAIMLLVVLRVQAFKDGDVRFLICTDVAARGIDISGLPYVINMTLPDKSEDYIHRWGGQLGGANKGWQDSIGVCSVRNFGTQSIV